MAATITLNVTANGITPAASSITRDSSLTITLNGLANVSEALSTGKLHVKAFDILGNVLADNSYDVAASVSATIPSAASALSFVITANETAIADNGGPVAILSTFPIDIDDGGSGGGGEGTGGGALIISYAAIDENTYRMDKTVGEIWDALNSGKTLWISTNSVSPATELIIVDQLVYGEYEGAWFFGTWSFEATANSEDNLRLQYPERPIGE